MTSKSPFQLHKRAYAFNADVVTHIGDNTNPSTKGEMEIQRQKQAKRKLEEMVLRSIRSTRKTLRDPRYMLEATLKVAANRENVVDIHKTFLAEGSTFFGQTLGFWKVFWIMVIKTWVVVVSSDHFCSTTEKKKTS